MFEPRCQDFMYYQSFYKPSGSLSWCSEASCVSWASVFSFLYSAALSVQQVPVPSVLWGFMAHLSWPVIRLSPYIPISMGRGSLLSSPSPSQRKALSCRLGFMTGFASHVSVRSSCANSGNSWMSYVPNRHLEKEQVCTTPFKWNIICSQL